MKYTKEEANYIMGVLMDLPFIYYKKHNPIRIETLSPANTVKRLNGMWDFVEGYAYQVAPPWSLTGISTKKDFFL